MSEQNADSQSSGGTDAASKDDLATFLREWDAGDGAASAGKGTPKAADESNGTESAADLRKRLEAMEQTLARTDYQSAMNQAVTTVRGELEVDDFLVEAWLNRKAESDPRIVDVWNNRDRNQAAFEETLRLMSTEFRKYAEDKRLAPAAAKKGGDSNSGPSGDEARAARAGARSAGAQSGEDKYGNLSGLDDGNFTLKKAEIFKAAKEGRLS